MPGLERGAVVQAERAPRSDAPLTAASTRRSCRSDDAPATTTSWGRHRARIDRFHAFGNTQESCADGEDANESSYRFPHDVHGPGRPTDPSGGRRGSLDHPRVGVQPNQDPRYCHRNLGRSAASPPTVLSPTAGSYDQEADHPHYGELHSVGSRSESSCSSAVWGRPALGINHPHPLDCGDPHTRGSRGGWSWSRSRSRRRDDAHGARGRGNMTRIWLTLFVTAVLLVPTARAQEVRRPIRVTDRTQFYSRPPGTVAFLPQVKESGDAQFAGQWDVLVNSGRYEVAQSDAYCFVVNHRDRDPVRSTSYVAIGALSILRSGTKPMRPISMFRNEGWLRHGDPMYPRDNMLKHASLTPERFAEAHDQDQLEENDRLLTDQWHGYYHGGGESWADRDVWVGSASADAKLLAGLAGIPGTTRLAIRCEAASVRLHAEA